jgi:hypothetical protein
LIRFQNIRNFKTHRRSATTQDHPSQFFANGGILNDLVTIPKAEQYLCCGSRIPGRAGGRI